MKDKVFISYSHNDKDFVRLTLTKELVKSRISIWIDFIELKFGDNIYEKITEAINNSCIMLAVLSKSSIASIWTRQEVVHALELRKLGKTKVIPILIEKIEDNEIPIYLKDLYRANLTGDDSNDFQALIDQLKEEPCIKTHSEEEFLDKNIEVLKTGMFPEKKNSIKVLLADGSVNAINLIFGNYEGLSFDIQRWIIRKIEDYPIPFKYLKPHIERIVNYNNHYISALAIGILIKNGELSYINELFAKIDMGDRNFYDENIQQGMNAAIAIFSYHENYNLTTLKRIKNILEEGLMFSHRETKLCTLETCYNLRKQLLNYSELISGIIEGCRRLITSKDKEITRLAELVYLAYTNKI